MQCAQVNGRGGGGGEVGVVCKHLPVWQHPNLFFRSHSYGNTDQSWQSYIQKTKYHFGENPLLILIYPLQIKFVRFQKR